MTGTCSGTIAVSPPYREATLDSCQFPPEVTVNDPVHVIATISQGSVSENYQLIFYADFILRSPQFIVNAGAGQQQVEVDMVLFDTPGTKYPTVYLEKVL